MEEHEGDVSITVCKLEAKAASQHLPRWQSQLDSLAAHLSQPKYLVARSLDVSVDRRLSSLCDSREIEAGNKMVVVPCGKYH